MEHKKEKQAMWDNVVDGVMNDNDWMREAKEDADNVVDTRDNMRKYHSLAQKKDEDEPEVEKAEDEAE